MTLKIGDKYGCSICGSEFIITKVAEADLKCCGKKLVEKRVSGNKD